MRLAVALLLCGVAGTASASGWRVQIEAGSRFDPGVADEVDAATMARWAQQALANEQRLGLDTIKRGGAAPTALRHPLLLTPGVPAVSRIGISNFVDLDTRVPDRLRDYACQTRTYDDAGGYNHQGIDYFLWPFPWQAMAQETVAVVAAAPGTIVVREDGRFDRNCVIDFSLSANTVWIRHDDGTVGVYLHFKSGSLTDKQVGQRVEAGEYLGTIGSSGASSGPHLHFEMRSRLGSGSVHLDPNQGQCQASPSLWERQPPYREPRLEMLAVHSAQPTFATRPACGLNERAHYATVFAPGAQLRVGAFYADQPIGVATGFVIRGPDGAEAQRFEHAPAPGSFGAFAESDGSANASFWSFLVDIPADASPGLYRVDASYAGVTRSQHFAVGGAVFDASGIWYDPAQSGQGFTTEVVQVGGRALLVAVWFTFRDGEPVWLSGVGPIENNRASVPVRLARGGRFPPEFRAGDVTFEDWGTLHFEFETVDQGRVRWDTSTAGFESGSMTLSRLARPADINDDDHLNGMRACTSGSWYDPGNSGHGVQLQVAQINGQRQLLLTWYVHHEGKAYWLTGIGPIVGKGATLTLSEARGGQFPPRFEAAAVTRRDWGTASVDYIDPQRIRLQWQGSVPGFGNGSLELSRLTELFTAPCR